jgi:cell division septum initiation protein DivIVA
MKYVLSEDGEKEAVLLSINEWERIVNEKNEIKHFLERINKKYPGYTKNIADFQQKIEDARQQFSNGQIVADTDLDGIISTW